MIAAFRSPLLALAALLLAAITTPARALDQITIQLDWVPRGDHAMFFVARDSGFFAAQGIEIAAIRPGTGSLEALRLVGSGKADFGFGDLPTLAVSRAAGVPVTALAAINQRSPLAMIALAKTRRLTRPQDLRGLTIGIDPTGSTTIFLKALLAANAMKLDSLRTVVVTPPYEDTLLRGEVDAIPGYIDAELPLLEAKAGGKDALSVLLGADFGYRVYGSGLFASNATLRDEPELVKRFVQAYRQAFAFTVANPDAAIAIMVKAAPAGAPPREVLRAQLQADIERTFVSDNTKAHGLGWMTTGAWQRTIKVLREQGALTGELPVRKVFTTRFLE
jgi:NitT/TauT family transport system substrate-binding protein